MSVSPNTSSWYTTYFKDKNITLMGLGLLGRGIADALFLLEQGARLTITDLKSEEQLQSSVKQLKKYESQITWVLGKHRHKDFQKADMVLRVPDVPLGNVYLKTAKKNGVPVCQSAALLVELIRREEINCTVIGVTGSKGKSSTTGMIEAVLRSYGKTYHLGGNMRGVVTLPLVSKIQPGDILLLELDSWQLQSFGEAHISPDIAVFTNFFADHMQYYRGDMKPYFKDKANIFRYQKTPRCFVSSQAKKAIRKYGREKDLEYVRLISTKILPVGRYQVIGEHMMQNLSLAYQVGRSLEIEDAILVRALESFQAVEGRMQLMGNFDEVTFYNDNNSTTPESTIYTLKTLKDHYGDRRIIWIGGGSRKKLDYKELAKVVSKTVEYSLLFRGEGSEDIASSLQSSYHRYSFVDSIQTMCDILSRITRVEDIVVFSPAAASFGIFINEYDRNDQFVQAVNKFSRAK